MIVRDKSIYFAKFLFNFNPTNFKFLLGLVIEGWWGFLGIQSPIP